MRDNIDIRGISVSNPVDVEKEYLLYTVDYAIKNNMNHIQFIGPIHNNIKGNIDGMTLYRKYSRFNGHKDLTYIATAMDAINAACKKTKEAGVRTYVWHHELELPLNFKEVFPEVKNECGDIEVTHPLVKDFLENKIEDFFDAYPDIDGIILTLHETSVPLLKLKAQKLGGTERVKYVTKILYDTCTQLGKELIVRPFASTEEDYTKMAAAYESISNDLIIMDKWTQFDWSLSLPHNSFYKKIQNNPLMVEADIFGEFFGKGRLPLMLHSHIKEKMDYCEAFQPKGYVARIDRAGEIPFGDVNEVNLVIMSAFLNNKNVDEEIDSFFENKYGYCFSEVRNIMEQTEDVVKKIIYTKGYYYSELSFLPTLNHSKNHYYFEMMKQECNIRSNEWYVPHNWNRGSVEELINEKESAVKETTELLNRVNNLKEAIVSEEYDKLWTKFCNLKLVAEIWLLIMKSFRDYAAYFEQKDVGFEEALNRDLEQLIEKKKEGISLLGDRFYCLNAVEMIGTGADIECFVDDVHKSFEAEKKAVEEIKKEAGVYDYVICGGAMEGHELLKEVNFSDTLILKDGLCRIPGNMRGTQWSGINAHGWFSYKVAVKPNTENKIVITMGSNGEELNVKLTIAENETVISEKNECKTEYSFSYVEESGSDSVTIRFDKISKYVPYIYEIKVK